MIVDDDRYLKHYGVLGMKWGVRRNLDGVSNKTNKDARKDAEEFARAKMFFGEGAGTRRKLIKATVEAKSQKSESYKRAFDHHLANQDMDVHASKARGQRSRADKAKTTRQGAGYIARRITGEMGTTAALTAVAFGAATIGGAYLKSRVDPESPDSWVNTLVNDLRRRYGRNRRTIRRML